MTSDRPKLDEGRDLLARVQFEQLRAGLGLVDELLAIYLDPEHRFKIEKVIGSGGMGVVYLGYDAKLARPVAIKVVRGHPDELEQLEVRLHREAQILATLRDRNILVIYDVGRSTSGELFIATEYVDGPTLREWQKGRPRKQVLRVYIEAGRGLVAAHERRIVHRDFKPDNVLIEDRSPPRVCVGDFGLAGSSVVAPDAAGRRAGGGSDRELLGTPEYMAPEQRARQPATASSDQFAFCVALWEAWMGGRPQVGESVPARPKAMPRWLYRLLAIGLSPRPEDRHISLAVLLEQLTRSERRQRELRVITLVGTLLSLGVAGGYGVGQHRPVAVEVVSSCQREPQDAVWNSQVEAELQHKFSGHERSYMALLGDGLPRLLSRNASARYQLTYDLCELRHATPDNKLLDRREQCIERWRRQTQLQINRLLELSPTEFEHARALLQPLIEFETECGAATVGEPLDPQVVDALVEVQNAGLLFETQRAEQLGLAAVELASRRGTSCTSEGTSSRERGYALRLLGHDRRLHGRHDLAVSPLLDAIEIAVACEDDALLVDAQLDLAQLEVIDHEDVAVARPLVSSVRGALARTGGPAGVRRRAELFETEGFIELMLGNPMAAVSAYQRALVTLGDTDDYAVEAAKLHENIATAYQEGLRPAEAAASYERARTVLVRVLGSDHPATLRLSRSIALNQALLALYADELEHALASFDALVSAPELEIRAKASTSWLITWLSFDEPDVPGELARARAHALATLANESPALAARTKAEALSMAGLVLVRSGEEAGFEHMRAALAIWIAHFPKDGNTRSTAVSLCSELSEAGRDDEARCVLEHARSLSGPLDEPTKQRLVDLERELAPGPR